MQIERIFYPVKTLGLGNRVGIWTIGCPHACFNCSNPELWESNPTKEIAPEQVIKLLADVQSPVDGVTISGGEPFWQTRELHEMVRLIKQHITDDILIYTGYTIEELSARNDADTDSILEMISVLIDGKYIEEKNDNQALRGSSNQRVHILNERFREAYEQLKRAKRQVQTVFYQQDLLSIGIPTKGFQQALARQLPLYGILTSDREEESSC